MQHIIFWSCFAILSGCSAEWWTFEELPGEVVVTDERLEPYLDVIQESIDGYNEHFTTPILHLTVDYSAKRKCGRVYMSVGSNKGGEAEVVDECKQYQHIDPRILATGNPDDLRLTVQHELGHALFGPGHSSDENSVMYPENVLSLYDAENDVWLQHLTDEDLQEIADKYNVKLKN